MIIESIYRSQNELIADKAFIRFKTFLEWFLARINRLRSFFEDFNFLKMLKREFKFILIITVAYATNFRSTTLA